MSPFVQGKPEKCYDRISVKTIRAKIRFSFRNCILMPPFGIQDSRFRHSVTDGMKLTVTFNPNNHGSDTLHNPYLFLGQTIELVNQLVNLALVFFDFGLLRKIS